MAKTASLVFFYFGEDSYINRLAQETVPTWLALDGYDHSVLLRHETDVNLGDCKFELSEKAEQMADVIAPPTRQNLADQLNRLGEEGYDAVDIFIFSHGWKDSFLCCKEGGEYGDNATVKQSWLEPRVKPLNIRMVWQCNCYGSTMNDMWRNLGAKAAGGSKFVNFYPTRFKKFIKLWRRGETFSGALYRSDTKLVHTPVQLYILGDAAARTEKWDGNLWQAARVLGNNDHSRRYFRECWNGDDVPEGKSGKQIMNDSSKMLIAGNRRLRRDPV